MIRTWSVLKLFVVIQYDRTTTTFAVNNAHFEMFAWKQFQYDAIPPTRTAFLEHTKSAAYQDDHVWGQYLNFSQYIHVPSPDDWRWNVIGHQTGQHFRQLQRLTRNCLPLVTVRAPGFWWGLCCSSF